MTSESAQRMLALEKQVRAAPDAKPIDGYTAFKLTAGGNRLLASKTDEHGLNSVIEVEAAGEWANEAARLRAEQEYRALFGSVSEADFDEYCKLAKQAGF